MSRWKMPRRRKYDYQKDYPVRKAIYIRLPVETVNELEKMGITNQGLSNMVERFIREYVENNRKKD